MQVDATALLSAKLKAAESASSSAMYSGSFIDALNAAKKNAAQPPAQTPAAPPAVTQDVKSADNNAYLALIKYMKESPEEHLRDKILKDMGLTEQSLAALPPAQRSAIEDSIAKQIKEYMQAHNQTPPQSADAAKTMTLLPS
jgi:hypothetical protein